MLEKFVVYSDSAATRRMDKNGNYAEPRANRSTL